MNWNAVFLLLGLLELAGLLWIALMERASLEVDRLNHSLYKSFFEERTRWYRARGQKEKTAQTVTSNSTTTPPINPNVGFAEVVGVDETVSEEVSSNVP